MIMEAAQQYLFGDDPQAPPPAPDPQAEQPVAGSRLKEWSYSRREVFEKCQRLYYYQYYGASARTAKTDPQKERLRFLKGITNRYMRAGDIMHWAISCSLKARAKKGSEWSRNFLVEFARKRFQEDLSFSRGYKEGTPLPEELSAPSLLMELYYGLEDAEKRCGEVEEKMVRALQSFQTVAEYVPFRAGVDGDQAKVESPVSVKHQGVSLRGKVDLAFSKTGRANVVDWKMGEGDGGADSLQLLFYAIWAMQTFSCLPDQVDLFKAHLGGGTVSRFDFGPKAILRAEARISQDVERMRSVDEYGRDGLVEAFTPCGQERVCAGCVFQGVCPKE